MKVFGCLECSRDLIKRDNERPSDFTRRKFCGRSCANTYNNRGRIRHDPITRICPDCGKAKNRTSIRCHACKVLSNLTIQNERTLGDIMLSGNARVKWSMVRTLARRILKVYGVKPCCKYCGFDIVVDVCHLTPISEFDLSEKVRIVNHIFNLAYLCPNHHKLLDMKILDISEITDPDERINWQMSRSSNG